MSFVFHVPISKQPQLIATHAKAMLRARYCTRKETQQEPQRACCLCAIAQVRTATCYCACAAQSTESCAITPALHDKHRHITASADPPARCTPQSVHRV
jgi:hypothetical protein